LSLRAKYTDREITLSRCESFKSWECLLLSQRNCHLACGEAKLAWLVPSPGIEVTTLCDSWRMPASCCHQHHMQACQWIYLPGTLLLTFKVTMTQLTTTETQHRPAKCTSHWLRDTGAATNHTPVPACPPAEHLSCLGQQQTVFIATSHLCHSCSRLVYQRR
jgi:hypothetical protein